VTYLAELKALGGLVLLICAVDAVAFGVMVVRAVFE
jgi:hypothetical protein